MCMVNETRRAGKLNSGNVAKFYESSSTSSTRADLLSGLEDESPDSGASSCTVVCELPLTLTAVALALPLALEEDFSDFSLRFFLDFFLGRSHSHSGMNDSTYKEMRIESENNS